MHGQSPTGRLEELAEGPWRAGGVREKRSRKRPDEVNVSVGGGRIRPHQRSQMRND